MTVPRRQRIEYPGVVYPVMSRGNYRKDLFSIKGAGVTFANRFNPVRFGLEKPRIGS